MPSVTLDAGDAAELAEMLSFLGQWLARDPGRLGASLEDFLGNPGYGSQHLRDEEALFPSWHVPPDSSSILQLHDSAVLFNLRRFDAQLP